MRLLHTSDWHLGASFEGLSLLDEQQRFLDWLVHTLHALRVDALLISGDLFDHAHPSAEAQHAWFSFLARLRTTHPTCTVIATAGNHDSPARLTAPEALLHTLNVHTHGHLPTPADGLLLPLPNAEHPHTVIAAVPWVHEYHLGVRSIDHDPDTLRRTITDAFAHLYQSLAHTARQRWGPDIPLVAMGHLTVGRPGTLHPDDAPQPIHQVGTIDALPHTLFGPDYAAITLGHLHRAHPVDPENRCWYAGTPVAIAAREGEFPRRVRLLDLLPATTLPATLDPATLPLPEPDPTPQGTSAGTAPSPPWAQVPGGWLRQHSVAVPRWRTLRTLSGTEDEIVEQVRTLEPDGELPAILVLRVRVEGHDARREERLRARLDELPARDTGPRPIITRIVQEREGAADETAGEALPALDTLGEEDVFRILCRMRHGEEEVPERLLIAFREVAQAAPEESPE